MEIIQYAWKLALTGFLTSFMFVVLWFALMLIIATIINATGNKKNMSKTAIAKYCCSYYNIKDQTVKEADAVVRNICVNAEWYCDNPRGNATEIFTPCDEDEDNAYVIEGKRYMITFSSPYAELKKLYEKSKNKQLSLFDY